MPVSNADFVEEDFNFKNIESTKKIEVESNALTFGNTVYQISNISRVTVRKWKRIEKDVLSPFFILFLIAVGTALSVYLPEPRDKVISLLVILVGLFLFFDEKLRSPTYIYLLVIELNSGSVRYFASKDISFLEEAVLALYRVIENPYNNSSFTISLSDNRIIHNNSVTIGGDLLGTLFNNDAVQNVYDNCQRS